MDQSPCGKLCQGLQSVEKRLRDGDRQLDQLPEIKKQLSELRSELEALADSVSVMGGSISKIADIITAWDSVQGLGRVVSWVSDASKVLVPIGAAAAIIMAGVQWLKIKFGLAS